MISFDACSRPSNSRSRRRNNDSNNIQSRDSSSRIRSHRRNRLSNSRIRSNSPNRRNSRNPRRTRPKQTSRRTHPLRKRRKASPLCRSPTPWKRKRERARRRSNHHHLEYISSASFSSTHIAPNSRSRSCRRIVSFTFYLLLRLMLPHFALHHIDFYVQFYSINDSTCSTVQGDEHELVTGDIYDRARRAPTVSGRRIRPKVDIR